MSNAKVDGEAAAGLVDQITKSIRTGAVAAQPQSIRAQGSASAPGALPPQRDTVTPAPLAPDALYVYGDLDDKTFHSTLSDFVKQAQGECAALGLTLYYRVLPGLKDARRRFTEHQDNPQYRLDGCTGIEEYIEKLGLKPARVRKWRQRDKERQFMRELKLLSGIEICRDCDEEKGHAPSCPHYDHARQLTETQAAVVEALVAQGYKPKDALLMVESAEGQDFESLFRSALLPAVNHRATGMTTGRQEEPDTQVGHEDKKLDGAEGVVASDPEVPPSLEPKREPVPEPEFGSFEELAKRIKAMADTNDIGPAVQKYLDHLFEPLREAGLVLTFQVFARREAERFDFGNWNTAVPRSFEHKARVECADDKDPDNRDKNGRLAVECVFDITYAEKLDVMKAVEKLGHLRSTQVMCAALIKEARGQSDDI